MDHAFIGRTEELASLRSLLLKRAASLVVIRGRRRVGKSRLIAEFGKSGKFHSLSGLPVSAETSREGQLQAFGKQLAQAFGTPSIHLDNWYEAFTYLAKLTDKGRHIIALDEISWMGSRDPDFLGYLKTAWDQHFSKNPKLILILCGSVSSWIQKNILSSTGFVGRISIDMDLHELKLREACQFWDGKYDRISPYEIFKVLAVTGGVPRYLEEIQPHLTAEANIHALCFRPEGLLFREFDQIFSDYFTHTASVYSEIVQELSGPPRSLKEIARGLGKAESTLSEMLNNLVLAGFVTRDSSWNISSGKASTIVNFRLSDNYLRFYLRYILPQKNRIQKELISAKSIGTWPQWESVMGLQFENLVISNLHLVMSALGIDKGDVMAAGPFVQRPTKKKRGCQIDLMIQTRFRTVFLCEIKFSKNKIGCDVGAAIKEKHRNLELPRGWSARYALICVNGITSQLAEESVFDHVLDFDTLISPNRS